MLRAQTEVVLGQKMMRELQEKARQARERIDMARNIQAEAARRIQNYRAKLALAQETYRRFVSPASEDFPVARPAGIHDSLRAMARELGIEPGDIPRYFGRLGPAR